MLLLYFKKNIIAFLLLVSVILNSSCKNKNGDSVTPQNNPTTIAILQFGSHPVIDTVTEGFEERINQIFKNIEIKKYNGNFDISTINILSEQMVASKADILVSVTTPASSMLVGANRGLKPLIFTFVSNPIDIGYSVPRGLKNTTGISDKVDCINTMRLIRDILPKAKRIGYLLTRNEANAISIYEDFKELESEYEMKIFTAEIGNSIDIRIAAESLITKNIDLFLFGGDNNIASSISVLVDVANGNNIPIIACDEQSIESGALIGYSVDYKSMGKRTAEICGLVVAGANPQDLPVEEFIASKLIINMKVAKQLGIILPESVLEKANRLLE